ncbi:hypothetical protein EV126DRAFT_431944 [Verticillium dahliae]|nr:hypothetical protein EV126DRAFT_431944 [Verticillium dahliae]
MISVAASVSYCHLLCPITLSRSHVIVLQHAWRGCTTAYGEWMRQSLGGSSRRCCVVNGAIWSSETLRSLSVHDCLVY